MLNNFNSLSNNTAQSAWAKYSISAQNFLITPIEEIPCLVEPLLQKVGLACIAGSSDTGKSSFLRNLSMAIVSGKTDFLDFKINAIHKRVIYVSSEDDVCAVNTLINKQNNGLQLESLDLKGLSFVFETEELIKKLDEMLTEQRADMVCIDAFGDVFGNRNSNDNAQVRAFLNEYSQLAQKHECLIVFLHHSGKGKENLKPSKNNLLGSQGFEAKMRVVLLLTNDNVEAQSKHLCVVKGNYLTPDFKNESFKLRFTDDLIFKSTGERVPLEHLVKKDDEELAKYNKAKELREKGMKLEEIAKELGYSSKCKGNISKLFKKYEHMEN